MIGDNPYAPPKTVERDEPCVTTMIELSEEAVLRAATHRYDNVISVVLIATLLVTALCLPWQVIYREGSAFGFYLYGSLVVAGFCVTFMMIGVLARRFTYRQMEQWPFDLDHKIAIAAGKHGLWFTEDETLLSHKVPGKLRIWFYRDMIILSSARNILIPIPRTGHSDETWKEIQLTYRALLANC